ncbi:MAG: GH32 C-terminal domain-containing protein [Planctomycetes bacterium]|nr:GH32 C-terminal domain-containing protein [Planctomycetota bacterium]
MYRFVVLALPFWVLICWAGRAAGASEFPVIQDKTLVVWVYVGDLDQHGGSALTIEDGGDLFDGIVFGERTPRRWMAGSSYFARSQSPEDQASNPAETADVKTMVEMAIVYRGKEVTVYRNAERYAQYTINEPLVFRAGSFAVIGLRHVAAGGGACFKGQIEDARIYNVALSAEEIAALVPNRPSEPSPLAWWNFEDDEAADVVKTFPNTKLFGKAKVADGKLVLDGRGSYLVSALGNVPRWRGSSFGAQPGDDLIGDARALRARLLADPQRPQYHFVSPEGICHPFDPNGAIFWGGKYHLMYIVQHHGHCWGHATSIDLLHWQIHPLALVPGDGDNGIFSGGAFLKRNGRPAIIYHGVGMGNCIATAKDDALIEWEKQPGNPIVPSPKEGDPDHGKYRSWDPHGWREGDTYYAIFGGSTPTLFRSTDLKRWEFRGPFIADRKWINGGDASCPDFFPLGDRHVFLFISHDQGVQYVIGRWENEQFHPESHAMMTWPGGRFFAPETLVDDSGRRILWAWVCEARSRKCWEAAGWSGVMSMPQVLSLAKDHTLRIEPVAEIERLRMNERMRENIELSGGAPLVLDDVRGDCLEILLEIEVGEADRVGLKVRRSPDGEEETVVAYDAADELLVLDVTRSSSSEDVRYGWPSPHSTSGNEDIRVQKAPFALAAGEPLRLRVFLDRSIIEVHAGDRQCVTQRIYPTREDALGVSLFAQGGRAKVRSVKSWDMAPTNPW